MSFPRNACGKNGHGSDHSRWHRRSWPCASRSRWVRPGWSSTRRTATRCRRTLSASLARCTCIATGSGSWPAATIRVRIVAGRYEAVHQRLFGDSPGKSTLPEHRAQRVAAASGKRAKRYMQREHLLEIGRVALEYLTELTHRRPRVWIRDVARLHDLLERHGDEALRTAFERGLMEQAIGAEYISHYLEMAPRAARPGPIQNELPL